MTDAPTIVLVHGAFADSSAWTDTVAELESAGYLVLALPNQLRSLANDADYVRAIVATIDGPVILVGHSYGGAVIGEAARGAQNVRALVFVGAYILEQGESIFTVLDPARFPGGMLGPDTTIARGVPNVAASGGHDTELWIAPADFHRVFAADSTPERAHAMAISQRPLALAAATGIAGPPAWRDLPNWALVTEQDSAIPPAGQRWMAQRAGAVIESVAASHAVMVSRPDAVASLVVAAVKGTA
jgi:pimeloyl-ACP methyl ester carboxylesterase